MVFASVKSGSDRILETELIRWRMKIQKDLTFELSI